MYVFCFKRGGSNKAEETITHAAFKTARFVKTGNPLAEAQVHSIKTCNLEMMKISDDCVMILFCLLYLPPEDALLYF